MKRLPLVLAAVLMLLPGCALFPKQVEFFQKKVQPLPTVTDAAVNRQRQAADYIARSEETNRLAKSLSASLGAPLKPWYGSADELAYRMDHDRAVLQVKVEKFAKRDDSLAGKKIEGTGFIRMPYFVFLGCVVGLLALIWVGVRIYGLVNPIVGTASGVIGSVSSSVLAQGFSELVSGGSQFLTWVENSNLASEAKSWITNTFKVAHQTQQSTATQAVVNKLIATPLASTRPPSPAPSTSLITP